MNTVTDKGWMTCPVPLDKADAVRIVLADVYDELYQRLFADDPSVNHRLPIQVLSLRRIDGWAVCLLLTPWMLSRIFLADQAPGTPSPPESWLPADDSLRREDDERSAAQIVLENALQSGYLNYHPLLGHYIVQPLNRDLAGYGSAAEVFQAWRQSIDCRIMQRLGLVAREGTNAAAAALPS